MIMVHARNRAADGNGVPLGLSCLNLGKRLILKITISY